MKFRGLLQLIPLLIFLLVVPYAHADLDWGGGATRYMDLQGEPLTPQTGLAVLVALQRVDEKGRLMAGQPGMDEVNGFWPQNVLQIFASGGPWRWGAVSARALASSRKFLHGYLLLSMVDDLPSSELEKHGVDAETPLYLLVWDSSAFAEGKPTLRSRLAMQRLYCDGVPASSGVTPLRSFPLPGAMLYPDRQNIVAPCIRRGGRPGDVDGNGVIELADAVLALWNAAETAPPGAVATGNDVDDDGEVGIDDALFVIQVLQEGK